jgi:hypothetical protein
MPRLRSLVCAGPPSVGTTGSDSVRGSVAPKATAAACGGGSTTGRWGSDTFTVN